MNDFDYEVMQKKRIASSARHRVCGSKSRYCGLPSDHLTPAQIKKRSGPVMSYAMNLPMDWNTFKSMPLDLQQSYLDGLHSRFDVSASAISRDLFGLSEYGLRRHMDVNGLKPISTRGSRMSRESQELWENWLNPPVEPATEKPDVKEPEETTVVSPVYEYGVLDATSNPNSNLNLDLPVLRVTEMSEPQPNVHQWLEDFQRYCEQEIKSTITMEPRVRDFEVSDLSATFTGKFDAQKFLKWVSQLPMPEGDVKIRVEVTAR